MSEESIEVVTPKIEFRTESAKKGKASSLPELAKNPQFLKLCRSKIITKDPQQKEKLAEALAYWWPLLCEKFKVPFYPDLISQISISSDSRNPLTKLTRRGYVCRYNPITKAIMLPVEPSEREFVHELAHASFSDFDSFLGTPRFISEGIAQAGESFVDIPDVQKKREQIAQKPFGEKLRLALSLLQLHGVDDKMVMPGYIGLFPPLSLSEIEELRIPSGNDIYSSGSEMFFRYLLETGGPDKLKKLSKMVFLLRGEKQIKKAFEKIYGEDFEEIRYRSANHWCGDEAAKQAWEQIQKLNLYRSVLEKKFGDKELDRLYGGRIFVNKGEFPWGEGDFDVLRFSYTNEAPKGPFFIDPNGKVVEVKIGKQVGIKHHDSLQKAID